jgi:predicted transcriptional regulator
MQLIDKLVGFGENADGLFIKQTQYIPDDYLSDLRKEREDSLSTPAGEFHRVASIPTAIVDKWIAEGFDINVAPIAEILKRLRSEQFDGFITSNKV